MDIKKQIEAIRLIKQGLSLSLVFTTDEVEIKASIHNVRSKVYLGEHFTIVNLPTNKYFEHERKSLLMHFDDQMYDLIKFVEAGNKVIPPVIACSTNYFDWTEQPEKTYMFNDGFHRSLLANILGIKEIPYIIRHIEKHVYSISKNDFILDENLLTVSGPASKKKSFSLDDYYFNLNSDSETVELDSMKSLVNPKNFQ